jgi:hypothetical protein
MLNILVLGQALIGTKVHGWGDTRRAANKGTKVPAAKR